MGGEHTRGACPVKLPRPGTTAHLITQQLFRIGPLANWEIAEDICEHSGGVSRTMANLRDRGLVCNIAAVKGRGSRAVYDLTPQARAAIAKAERVDP